MDRIDENVKHLISVSRWYCYRRRNRKGDTAIEVAALPLGFNGIWTVTLLGGPSLHVCDATCKEMRQSRDAISRCNVTESATVDVLHAVFDKAKVFALHQMTRFWFHFGIQVHR